ncbi:hypothetical protein T484DRAFT_3153416 [Baffinella frigidus]|nr:hypothetical protein T484DRAFT_3153416 [Cryptophyta sp. CCMP2293]
MQIGSLFLTCSITVLEQNSMEFLLGLDNLRKYQMIIDLKDNLLRCGEHSVPFLGEGDIPRHLREDAPEEGADRMDVDAGAGGASSGGGGAAGESAAIMGLRSANGNVELAASLLFGGAD